MLRRLVAPSLRVRGLGFPSWAPQACGALPWPQQAGSCRPIHVTGEQDSEHSSPPHAEAVLENVRAQEFLGELRALKKQHRVMSHPDFLGHYMKSTKTADSESAERACAALSTSGLILQHGPVVYLHPEEIARSVMQVLPHQAEVLRAELADVERELTALKAQRSQIERRVAWRRWAGQSLGLGLILLPWVVLFRLTYWDLSWDVVEPIGFFLTGLTTVLSYLWYMQHRKDFTWDEMHHRMLSKWEEKAYRQFNFDAERYEHLSQKAERLKDVLRLCGPTGAPA